MNIDCIIEKRKRTQKIKRVEKICLGSIMIFASIYFAFFNRFFVYNGVNECRIIGYVDTTPFHTFDFSKAHASAEFLVIKKFADTAPQINKMYFDKNLYVLYRDTFSDSNITEVTFGKNVREIGGFFENRKIEKVIIEGQDEIIEKEINDFAFWECENLTQVVIPSNVTKIGNGAFGQCYLLTDITLPEQLEIIDEQAFTDCAMEEIVIPPRVKKLERIAFARNDNLKKIYIPKSVIKIDESTFYESENVKIYTTEGAYAQEYARIFGIPCEIIEEKDFDDLKK